MMLGLYLFALGLGGVLLAATFFGDSDAPDDAADAGWQNIFSLRNLTYFLFVFGAVGSLLTWARGGAGIDVLAISAVTALVVAAGVHWVFGYLRRTEAGEMPSDAALVGQAARVTLPVSRGDVGKIELTFGGQRVELLARPFRDDDAAGAAIANGTEVVIVEMAAGMALVSRTSPE
jgi:hypothetical protein